MTADQRTLYVGTWGTDLLGFSEKLDLVFSEYVEDGVRGDSWRTKHI